MFIKNFIGQFKKHIQLTLISLTFILTIFGFQNCSDQVAFQSSSSLSAALSIPSGSLTLNKGAAYSNNQQVDVEIFATDAVEMILQNSACPEDVKEKWVQFIDKKNWLLEDAEGKREVYLRLKSKDGVVSDCVKAAISLDRKSPTTDFALAPQKLSALSKAQFEIRAEDETSGIEKLFCRMQDSQNYEECEVAFLLNALNDGTKSLTVYAIDRAGNKSAPMEYSWFIDLTPPTVKIIAPFAASPSIVNSVMLHFEGSDIGGSGVDKYKCMVNGGEIPNCSSPVLLKDVADGKYIFKVQSIDKVGLESQFAQTEIVVDTKPSGDFNILGVTSAAGGVDVKVDGFLSAKSAPAIHWSASADAQVYRASIYDDSGTQILCGPVDAAGNATMATFANCALADGVKYQARVSAFRNTLEKAAANFAFVADYSGPTIKIVNMVKSDETKQMRFDFEISDIGSGVQTATCLKTYKTDVQQSDCTNLKTVTYANLPEGPYSFSITAVDKLGHASTLPPVNFTMEYIVCDPFKLVEGKCQKGLRARLYSAAKADRDLGESHLRSKFNVVQKLIDLGVKSNALIYLPSLDVRTRDFTAGFSTTENNVIVDDAGIKLDEWFALDMETVVKLGQTDLPGFYQLMAVSDDGSIVEVVNKNANTQNHVLILNDGAHSTKVGCSAQGDVLQLTAASRIPLRIKYYQGPRTKIAMSLFWRRVENQNDPHSAHCGKTGSSGIGFGTPESYELLIREGFKPLSENNFILDEVAP